MKFSEYKYLIFSDLYRITGKKTFLTLIRYVMFGEAYQYTFWMRTCSYTKQNTLSKLFIYPFLRIILNHYMYKYGISISPATEIKSGFYIGHFGGIVVNHRVKIGRNCNISQGVTIGQSNRGKYKGYPVIGDHVYIGPGAKIIGAVHIGNYVAIGANCVVTKDIPDYSVVVGIPGKVIGNQGSEGYINHTDY